jgi:ribosome-associated protein
MTIQLDQFLKFQGLVSTGGEAKHLIQSGEVKVNGETEIRRGRKLQSGDEVTIGGETYPVKLAEEQ